MTPELEHDIELGHIGQTEGSGQQTEGSGQQTEGSGQTEGSQQTEGSGHCASLSLLVCIIFAVICIVASLQYNTASGNEIIVLEGPIVIVFGLGVAIIACLIVCASAVACDVCNICCIAL